LLSSRPCGPPGALWRWRPISAAFGPLRARSRKRVWGPFAHFVTWQNLNSFLAKAALRFQSVIIAPALVVQIPEKLTAYFADSRVHLIKFLKWADLVAGLREAPALRRAILAIHRTGYPVLLPLLIWIHQRPLSRRCSQGHNLRLRHHYRHGCRPLLLRPLPATLLR
jgi:hypothetical protein